MWYVGIIVIIVAFVFYIRSSMKEDTEKEYKEEKVEEEKKEKNETIIINNEPNRRHRIHRPTTYRDYGPMRTSRSARRQMNERSSRPVRESHGMPRGGGTAGNRDSSASNGNNSNPSGGRR